MGNLTSVLMIILTISIITSAATPILGYSSLGDSVLFSLLNKDKYENKEAAINSDLDKTFIKDATASGSVNFFSLLDGTAKVFSFLISILFVGFAVFNLLVQSGAPFLLCALIGLPIGFGFYISIIGVIRGLDI